MACLPADCLSEIFSYLENDINSLYNAILVNRLWCERAVRYLWKQPFYLRIKSFRKLSRVSRNSPEGLRVFMKLANTLLQCIQYNQKRSNGDIRNAIYILKFDYISFIRRLNFYHLRIVLMQWARFLRANPEEFDTELVIEILQRRNTRKFAEKFLSDKDNSILVQIIETIERSLILQIPNLECFSIYEPSLNTKLFWNIRNNLYFIYPEGDLECFSRLTNFEWSARTTNGENFLRKLCNVARNLKAIKFDWYEDSFLMFFTKNTKNDEILIDLIKSQKSLQEFHFSNYSMDMLPSIVTGLKFQSENLTKIVLKDIIFKNLEFLNFILNLKNLQDLIIKRCDLKRFDQNCWPLEWKIPHLIKFEFLYNYPFHFVRTISDLQEFEDKNSDHIYDHNNSTLKEIKLNQHISNPDILTFSNFISTNCPNISKLELNSYISVTALSQILSTCSNLEKIIIKDKHWSISLHKETVHDVDKIMNQIVLTKLKKLELEGAFSFNHKSFEKFLNNSTPPLKKLIITGSSCFGNDHLKVIMDLRGENLRKVHILSAKDIKKTLVNKATRMIKDFKYNLLNIKTSQDLRILRYSKNRANRRN
ncbi:3331_t:CDS:1 [Entrophospora sp. SA101]|nr:487_t:CDS:1 [Entrophospora candida]CAH1767065.1 4496_t:CDS:1 [Entrophospora sp. SA101]CAJ0768295.1 3331_t:CDS:1 [Entrophospora sp. SA101]CAJ0907443.1 6379_t:CDS:1 [Entrophospora sp. SA101]CAJ0921708.1 6919_t:CDS:1 [Entrophospora sp. SA101]